MAGSHEVYKSKNKLENDCRLCSRYRNMSFHLSYEYRHGDETKNDYASSIFRDNLRDADVDASYNRIVCPSTSLESENRAPSDHPRCICNFIKSFRQANATICTDQYHTCELRGWSCHPSVVNRLDTSPLPSSEYSHNESSSTKSSYSEFSLDGAESHFSLASSPFECDPSESCSTSSILIPNCDLDLKNVSCQSSRTPTEAYACEKSKNLLQHPALVVARNKTKREAREKNCNSVQLAHISSSDSIADFHVQPSDRIPPIPSAESSSPAFWEHHGREPADSSVRTTYNEVFMRSDTHQDSECAQYWSHYSQPPQLIWDGQDSAESRDIHTQKAYSHSHFEPCVAPCYQSKPSGYVPVVQLPIGHSSQRDLRHGSTVNISSRIGNITYQEARHAATGSPDSDAVYNPTACESQWTTHFTKRSAEEVLTGYSYSLQAATSAGTKQGEDRMTYLNKGQNYELTLQKTTSANERACVATSTVILSIMDEKNPGKEMELWKFWQHGQIDPHASGIVITATGGSEAAHKGPFHTEAVNATSFMWATPGVTKVNLVINALSTDFSHQKGVKGLTLILQVDTREDSGATLVHRGYARVKVFCDKGAERKSRDESRKQQKRKEPDGVENSTTNSKKRRGNAMLYQPSTEATTFYSMKDLAYAPVLVPKRSQPCENMSSSMLNTPVYSESIFNEHRHVPTEFTTARLRQHPNQIDVSSNDVKWDNTSVRSFITTQ